MNGWAILQTKIQIVFPFAKGPCAFKYLSKEKLLQMHKGNSIFYTMIQLVKFRGLIYTQETTNILGNAECDIFIQIKWPQRTFRLVRHCNTGWKYLVFYLLITFRITPKSCSIEKALTSIIPLAKTLILNWNSDRNNTHLAANTSLLR